MALEVKLGQDLRLRQQLVMTPQLQQAIKILQLSLPELEAVVQTELESNPAARAGRGAQPDRDRRRRRDGRAPDPIPGAEPDCCRPSPNRGAAAAESEWNGNGDEQPMAEGMTSEARDATARDKEHDRIDKLDWREYIENYSNNWQDGRACRARRRTPPDRRKHADPQDLARRPSDVATAAVQPGEHRSAHRRDHHLQPQR